MIIGLIRCYLGIGLLVEGLAIVVGWIFCPDIMKEIDELMKEDGFFVNVRFELKHILTWPHTLIVFFKGCFGLNHNDKESS